jgi:hypothetical protein
VCDRLESLQALDGFLGGAPDQDFDHFALVFCRAPVVVHGIAFRSGNFAHFSERGIMDRFPAQNFFGFFGAHDGRRD